MPKIIKVLSFDLDDTLWPCFPTIQRAEKKLYQWLSEHVPSVTQQYSLDQLREKRHRLLDSHVHLAHNLTQLRIKSFEMLADELGLTNDWIGPAFKIFYEARQQVNLFDDVKPVLDELNETFKLVSVTNGNASTIKTGVDHWFDFGLNSASVGKLKSEPDIYRQVQKLSKIEAQQMVHIGDHPLQDVAGAKSAGVFAVWLNREEKHWTLGSCQPDAVINSLYELPALLSKLQR